MRGRLLLAPFFGFLLLSGCGPQKESEPNDDFSRPSLARVGRLEGNLSSPTDVDIYQVEAKQESVLSVRVGGVREADFVLSVRDKDRFELKRVDETASGGDEELLDIGLAPGPYYVVLANKNERVEISQPYQMSIKMDKSVGREREPNESIPNASPLELPGVTRGHHHPSRNLLSGDTDYLEVDWHRLEVSQSGAFLLNLELSGVPRVDAMLEIYDVNGYRLRQVDQNGAGEGEVLRHLGVRGPAQYRIRLLSKTRSGNPSASYEILTELIPYQGRNEFEPNDQRSDATVFEAEAMEAQLSPEGDVDWYRIAVAEENKQILSASVSGIEGLDISLAAGDGLGSIVVTADNMGLGQPETLTGLGAVKGDYYLIVSGRGGRKEGRRQYELTRSLSPFQPGLEFEMNDSMASAQPIKIGESVDGFLAPKGDLDVYQFNVYRKGSVLFELAGVLNVQPSASLFDQDNKPLGNWSAPKAGDSLSFEKALDLGTYYIELRAGPEQSNVRDKYSLRLKAR
ncbi:MAG: hypothetical protein HY549_05265 [Elusimicrobia bacterium]|nr:hypothetical protein [Elusimicrobiota bacterium]